MAKHNPPVRSDPLASAGTGDIAPELEAQLTIQERRKAAARKAKRPKATYDLTSAILDAVDHVSEQEDIAKSDVVAWALIEFLARYEEGGVDLEPHKVAARSLRYTCKLILPERWH